MFDLHGIGAGLPVARTIGSFPAQGNVVVQAPPGTGKTTLVPPALANQTGGKVIVTAPRRVAVRAAANRLMQLSGQQIGYAVRGDSRQGRDVEFVTPGVLLRRLLRDPELPGVAAVAIDEVHERQLDSDLVLAMCLELAQLRDDFRVVAMSATVDAQRFARLMNAPVHVTQAPTYPLEISYRPAPSRSALYQHVAAQVPHHGSTLVFVPGVREVNQVCTLLADAPLPVMALHGQQSNAEQDAAINAGYDRIVVATSIAESSLTVPGVRCVVDAGLSRVPKRDSRRGMSGLVTVSTSKSSADQRAGRAGREGPGRVIRCYSAADFQRFPAHITPEIVSADLTQAALFMQVWGAGEDFPLLDSPPAAAWEAAQETLVSLGATGSHARDLALLPTDPRMGHALIQHGARAARTVAALNDARGDIARVNPLKREVDRLSRLVPDKGPVESGAVVATAFPELVAHRVDGSEYLLASGTRARLLDDSGLQGTAWLAVADVSLSQAGNAVIRAAARVSEEAALAAVGVEETVRAFVENGKVKGLRVRQAGAIVLSQTPVKVDGPQAVEALRPHAAQLFRFSDKAANLRDRLRHLHRSLGDPWPDPDNLWLDPELEQVANGTDAHKVDMYPALQRILPWPEATRLDELAPQRLPVPSGRDALIDWSGERPVVAVKLQELFGLADSPRYCGQRVQFHLLSPAGRPLAVTDDLASFWAGPYQGVRADMRGRYPKHPWPEDPTTAVATAKTTRRR